MTFSVIVPTYNRMSLLKKTLESLFRQDFSDFEIIVVNDGSTDQTDEYLKTIPKKDKITYIRQNNQGLASARSAGLQVAKGTYIVFTDDDCVVPRNWLEQFREFFQQRHAVCVGGACITGNPENPFADANDTMQNYFKEMSNSTRGSIPFFTGNNVAYTRSVLEKVGGPDKRFRMGAEDRDLLYRVYETGGTVVYAPTITIEHFNDANFWKFLHHQYEFGKGSYLYYSGSTGKRHAAFPPSVYIGLFFQPFKSRSFVRACLLFLLILLAQIAVTIGYFAGLITHKIFPSRQVAAFA